MDISAIVLPIVSLGGMGLLFGAGLAFASQKFAVEVDPRVVAVRDALPGANCGGCGYPGCDGFANGVVAGNAPVNGCPVGGPECAQKIAEIMGVDAGDTAKKVARVICNGDSNNCKEKFNYFGIQDCKAAAMIAGGSKSCAYGCLGLGTCVKACQFDAIEITDGKVARIIPERCTACGKCIEVCPKQVIHFTPYEQDVVVDCNNEETGKAVRQKCSVGCIACQICVKACPFDAMEFSNNLAKINYEKCTNCMICAEKCPTKAIYANFEKRRKAEIIAENCIGCTICKKQCPVNAIEGELKQVHKVNSEKCIGCGVCEKKCPKKTIKMS
ncbi:electron transport complex, RnfABCDGE type, B subunit [Geosporobacter subterraneus DSM 17957]|uniref:Ion-translocating oxidoreductase complex subunit B n=1 Tax=Geosporobacter subterraneus DSM 17957 TaxID=1121919 RepID=A0A1M6N309_9FIRM|nr:RnfABCDGE type electron transport complex subunit B [Geosporobacter subterraneus]SHJ90046.1 electron transport complex, RnfABCDGE type, B subunit [Geosporobacter subterraneus DSM 17957]